MAVKHVQIGDCPPACQNMALCLVRYHPDVVAEILFDAYHYFLEDFFVAFFHSSGILSAGVGM